MPKRAEKPEWARVAEEFEASGQTQREFAERRGLRLSTLQSWVYRRRRQVRTEAEPPVRRIRPVNAVPDCLRTDGSCVRRLSRALGREGVGDLPLPDERLSRQHAEVRRDGSHWHVEDLGGRNGTFVDGEQVVGRRTFTGPRVLRLGNTLALFREDVRQLAGADAVSSPDVVRAPPSTQCWSR